MSETVVAFGLCIGNSNAVIAGSLSNKEVVICENKSGEISTPNCISFFQGECHIGRAALRSKETNPKTTYYNILRLIGKRPYDQNVIEEIKDLSYPVDLNYKNPFTNKRDDRIRLPFNIPEYHINELYPEHLVALLMKYLYDCGQNKSPTEIKDAVLTCPHSFNENQRRAMKDSGVIAGFNVLEVIEEPIAATISYLSSNQESKKEERLMVFDFGGTSLSVSIVEVRDLKIRVIAEYRDDNLGGKNIDMNIFEYVSNELLSKYNFNVDRDSKYKVLEQCETAKNMLSMGIPLYNIFFDNNSIYYLRAFLENDVLGYKERMNRAMEMALKRSKQSREGISNILMVGGSSMIPLVKSIVSEYMGREVYSGLDPIKAIPEGAAIYGAILKGIDFNLSGLTVHSRYIGIEMFSDGFHEIRSLFRPEDYMEAKMPITVGPIKIKGSRGSKSIRVSVFSSEEDIFANASEGESQRGREGKGNEGEMDEEKNKDNQKEEMYDEDGSEKLKVLMSKLFTNPTIGKDRKPYIEAKLEVGEETIKISLASGEDKLSEELREKRDQGFTMGEIKLMQMAVYALSENCHLKEEGNETSPARKTLEYIMSPKGRKELVGDKKISLDALKRITDKYKAYVEENPDMTQADSIKVIQDIRKEVHSCEYDGKMVWYGGLNNYDDDEEEEEKEEALTPARNFICYISSPVVKKELTKDKKSKVKAGSIIRRYIAWAQKNKNATEEEVLLKLDEMKEEIKALK